MLASQLPRESRVKASLAGDDEGQRWSEGTHLLADQLELLQMLRIEQLAGQVDKKDRSKIPKFHPVQRPGMEAEADADESPSKADPERYEAIQKHLATLAPPPPPARTPN